MTDGSAEGAGDGTSARRPTLRERRPSGSAMRFDDAEPVTFVLVRHGETAATLARSLSGSGVPGPGLSAAGRVQAARAADLVFRIGRAHWTDLPHPDAVVSSPMVRTRETATIIGRRLGAQVRADRRAQECDFGAWEGLTPDEVDAASPGTFRAWHLDPAVRAPGGESLEDVGERMTALLAELTPDNLGHSIVVVSHVMAIRTALGRLLQAPPSAWRGIRIPPASLTIVRRWADGTVELVCAGTPSDL
ncbi:histidine phosphatase family protein [Isoptericola sp. b490]|uniref:histidine phosphatase family protein n=1 Tax=Actinotalea lenta TaxID=3064654 RepID=UPI0027134247|nr:histidine phosphatase family protein [Isoptericola sp. b490]MDO8120279.1 histidine phosphatase family protein [Isoptericola sp. b490]